MRRVLLHQGSPEWHEWRKPGLGSSDAWKVLLIEPPWVREAKSTIQAELFKLWEHKTGIRPHEDLPNFAMRRGTRLEPTARFLYETETGNHVEPACVLHDTVPFLRSSLDGLDWDDTLVVELKAPRIEVHRAALAKEVVPYYFAQCQYQLLVTGIDLCHYVTYSENRELKEEDRLAVVDVRPDRAYQARLYDAASRFWECVEKRVPPEGCCP